MAAAEVLRQRMPELIIRAERRHVRPRARRSRDFHPAMIGFDRVARVLLHDMTAASSSPHHGKTSPSRRYQRTATMMTSGGKRKLAKPAWQAWLQLTDLGVLLPEQVSRLLFTVPESAADDNDQGCEHPQ